MVLTKQKVIPGKLDMNTEELDIIVDFKLLCDHIIRIMDFNGVYEVGAITKSDISKLLEEANTLYTRVGVDYTVDKEVNE